MEDKLDKILENQEVLNKNLISIYKEIIDIQLMLIDSSKKEFWKNYLADVAGTVTSLLVLEDLFKDFKKKFL